MTVLSSQFFYESKAVLKNKVCFLKGSVFSKSVELDTKDNDLTTFTTHTLSPGLKIHGRNAT